MKERVILLHGIFRTKKSMAGLARFLESNNFEVLNLSYPSTRQPLEQLAETIHAQIPQDGIKTYFIGYSMGGLLVRAYLARHRLQNLGRVVMIATPNHGSEVADLLKNFWPYKKLYGPAGQQLTTTYKLTDTIDYELGIIAGNRTIDPLCWLLIAKPNDGKVSTESTKLDGMKAHTIITATHTFFPANRKMWQLALNFLQTGYF